MTECKLHHEVVHDVELPSGGVFILSYDKKLPERLSMVEFNAKYRPDLL